MELRDYQSASIDKLRAAFTELPADQRRVVMVSPTGSGKTRIGAEISRLKTSYGKRVLWLAHRTELIDQSAEALETQGLTVGVVAAKSARRPNPYAAVQVASIQTLLARGNRPQADLVVFDECHHAAADKARTLLAGYPEAQVVGLTATPQRGDGRSLGDLFARMITVASIPSLIDAGHLVGCVVQRPNRPLKPGQIARSPVDAYHEFCRGRSTIVFSPNLREANKHTDEFRAAGIRAEMVEGATGRGARADAIRAFRAGVLPVIVNVGVLTEGTDLPVCSAIILARGCGTEGLYLQITGRALRPYVNAQTGEVKTEAVLCDLRGVSWGHGHPCMDRQYSLDGAGISHASEPNPYPACRVCGAPVTPGEACAECGTGVQEAKPLVVTGHALEPYSYMRGLGEDKRARSLAKWIKQGMEKGYKEGWALNRFRVVFGAWPDASVLRAAKGK